MNFFQNLPGNGLDAGGLGNVGRDGPGFPPQFPDFVGSFLHKFGFQVHRHDVGPVGGQFQRNGAANAPARAGHDGNLILKLFHGGPLFNRERA